MGKRNVLLSFILILTISLAACSTSASNEKDENENLTIYTTIYPLQFFAEQIGGEHVSVSSILPAGGDAHTFEPSSKMIVNIAKADMFIMNGFGLETYAEKISNAIERENVIVLEASEGINVKNHEHDEDHEGHDEHGDGNHDEHEEHGEHGEENHDEHEEHDEHGEENHDEYEEQHEGHDHGDDDPHIWLDPTHAITMAENIKDVLIELKPEAKEEFEANFASLKEELKKLDEAFHHHILEQDEKKILVSHAAFGYWEAAYGLEQIAVTGLSPSSEPSQKQIENILNLVDELQLHHILFEQNVTPKVADLIREEMNLEVLRIHNLAILTDDDIENGEDYFSLMYRNLDVLVEALSHK
ncbi:metal ABC transporter solute-binding protein, Zn/Mn family [Salirhabdus salicampi]|uniref:metal ABC transporter solute-binding protein, Zn/Mn family n=1 Tax=Salirhabdus salicampi TaxID=476102 RepID=UPI0020C4D46A|nr:zinc ABC transporter substrate-binding protein [Salirhabdus salicampi]MCP8616145.1 zinc ABC transporter substrate-binding protein [Salirhabdus salicampi]